MCVSQLHFFRTVGMSNITRELSVFFWQGVSQLFLQYKASDRERCDFLILSASWPCGDNDVVVSHVFISPYTVLCIMSGTEIIS
jgi:hypothetical protein